MCNLDCQNGGACVDEAGVYRCRCAAGYTGDLCAQEVDECSSNPCVLGNCIDNFNGYTCQCSPGYWGNNCDDNTDDCQSNPCFQGNCIDMLNKYTCSCNLGYHGLHCEGNSYINPLMSHLNSNDTFYKSF